MGVARAGGVGGIVLLGADATPLNLASVILESLDGGPNPKLNYLRTHDALREGDRVLTSGDGGVLPRGLPVGVATQGLDGGWRVSLDSDAAPIDFVQIMLFKDFSQLMAPQVLGPSSLPGLATGAPQAPPSPVASAPVTPRPSAATPAKAP